MFRDGLCHMVNIYPMERNTSNRTEKSQMCNSKTPIKEKVPCRIIRDEKVLFEEGIILEAGWVIEVHDTGIKYEIVKRKKVNALKTAHHVSYEIKKKVV